MQWLYPARKLSNVSVFPDRVVFTTTRTCRRSDRIFVIACGGLALLFLLPAFLFERSFFLATNFFTFLALLGAFQLYLQPPQIITVDEAGVHTRWRTYPWRKIRDLRFGYGQKGGYGLQMDRGFWFTSILIPWISWGECHEITTAIHRLFNARPYGKDRPRIH